MHFLEPARFLNAPGLAGYKVNVLCDPGLAKRPPPLHTRAYMCLGLKQPLCYHLHKIMNEPVFLLGQLKGAGP